MRSRDIAFALLILSILLILAVPTFLGALGSLPPENIRSLARSILGLTFNPYNKSLWTASPEAVAAIIWDYRGLDTLYETMVFYTAIIATLMLYREVLGSRDEVRGRGLSLIVKRGTAIALPAIVVVGLSTVLHGMLTPGGGFQGGAIMAVAPVVALIVFSRSIIEESRLTYAHLVALRSLALLGIVLVPLIPIIVTFGNAFIFQNQAKALYSFTYPSTVLDVPMGGLITFLNIFEGIAVFSAFTLAFTILLYSEKVSRKAVEGEDIGF
uniref:Sodium:proton antiporter n=1 Tax=Ignisphaera aggregans TaxID=334771 RepID=A0A7C2Z951_9CREN